MQAFLLYDTAPAPIAAPTPAYPEQARREGITGKVVLHVYVDEEGTPCWVRVLKGDPILADASVEAIRRWRFHPATSRGIPVGVWFEIPMDFKL
jgi:protein TonB